MIDSTAVVSPKAKIGKNVRIESYAIVEADVVIGDNCWLGHHSVIHSHTKLGHSNRIHPFAVLGGDPQSYTYNDELTRLEIGDLNSIRELVTISRGTEPGGMTRIGSNNMIMSYSHIAHDCQVGDNCVFANGTNIAGFVTVGDYAFFGGFTLVHQKCRVGAHSISGINTVLRRDAPPYVLCEGNPARVKYVNVTGLKRRGFEDTTISALKEVLRMYLQGTKAEEMIASLNEEARKNQCVQMFANFLETSERGVIR